MVKCNIEDEKRIDELYTEEYASAIEEMLAEMPKSEYEHISDVVNIGYKCAEKKDSFNEQIYEMLITWVYEAQTTKEKVINKTTETDIANCYNETEGVKVKVEEDRVRNVIPNFFAWFGLITLLLFGVFATIFFMGICYGSFVFNPVYLFMLTVGFFGLFLTDVAAIVEWRKNQNGQR